MSLPLLMTRARSAVTRLIAAGASMCFGLLAPAHSFATEGEAQGADPIRWKWTAGLDFSRGDYGLDEDTTLYYVPLGVTIDYQRIRLKLALPVLINDGPTRVIPGSGAESRTESEVTAGLGQLQAGVSYLFDPLAKGLPFVEVAGKVTAPTETDGDLGTGVWAFAIQVDLFQKFGRVTPYASAGRKFYTGDRLDDRFYTSVGASLSVTDSFSFGLAYDWLEASTSGATDASELVPYAAFRANESWSFGPYAVFGLTDGSPDYGVGMSVSFRP